MSVTKTKLLSIQDLCEQLGLSRSSVYMLLQTGQLGSSRVGLKRYRICETDLQEYLAKTRVRPPAKKE